MSADPLGASSAAPPAVRRTVPAPPRFTSFADRFGFVLATGLGIIAVTLFALSIGVTLP